MLWAAYGWGKPEIGVVLTEGTSEIELASVFDVYPGPVFTEHHLACAGSSPLACAVGARPLLRPSLRPR